MANLDLETAKRVLEEEEKKIQDEFIKEYEELCKKYGYRIVPIVNLQLNKI